MTKDPDTLVRQMADGQLAVVEQLAALEDVCLVDSGGRTLFDAAIINNHLAAVELLAKNSKALGFHAPIDQSSQTAVKHTVEFRGIRYPITEVESHLEASFGCDLSYGRTPLLTACRTGNERAIALLLQAGAKTSDRDLLGLTAPELSFYSGGAAGLKRFLKAFQASGQKKLPVNAQLLQEVFSYPELVPELLGAAKLGTPAQRLLFCYHCARLDGDAIERQLAEGFDLNKSITSRLHPLEQVCTAEMLWENNLPGSDFYAYHLKKHAGPAGSHSVSVDNSRINEDGSNLRELMAEAERNRKALLAHAKALTLDRRDEDELIARRCALIDTLLGAGLDIALAEEKLDEAFFEDLKEMGQGSLVEHLRRRGFSVGKDEGKAAAVPLDATSWELSGETSLSAELWPLEDATGLIRLTLNNPYGPIDDVVVELRPVDPDGAPLDEWIDVICVRELLEMDGDFVDRATASEPVYGEAPWQAIHEYPLARDGDPAGLEIRISCDEDESLNGVLDAWIFARKM